MNTKLFLLAACSAACLQPALADDDPLAFVRGGSLTLLNRNYAIYRDYRHRHATRNYQREWAHGLIAQYESGFTPGAIGLGFDAHALIGLRLDSGRGRSGTRLLPVDSDGRARNEYSKFGGAIKLRVSDTVLKYGDQFVHLPILSTDDSRLLPESVSGFLLTSREIEGLEINAGHFTSLNTMNQSGHDSVVDVLGKGLRRLNLFGATYRFDAGPQLAAYHSDVADYWKKKYLGVEHTFALSGERALDIDFNYYQVKSQGELDRLSAIDSDSWSLAASYRFGAHALLLGYQRISGTGGMPIDIDGGDSIYLTNSAIFSDFTEEDERSWQLGYALDATSLGAPGLSFSIAYVRGHDINPSSRHDGRTGRAKEWERDIAAAYVFRQGRFKDLSIKLRQFSYRSSGLRRNIDEIRLIFEYPLQLL